MLAKCLNPACSAPFRYMHEGRIFRIDTAGPPSANGLPPAQNAEHFWLCASCAMHLKVVVEDGEVTTRPMTVEPVVRDFPRPSRFRYGLSVPAAKKARAG